MKLETKMNHFKNRRIRKSKKIGIWENFGQEEVRVLESEYSDYQYKNDGVWQTIRDFDNWCMNFS